MKLYTEEQVREAYLEGWNDGKHDNVGYIDRVLHSLIPIVLPSDEEIETEASDFGKKYRATTYEKSAYVIGAKYVRDKILNK